MRKSATQSAMQGLLGVDIDPEVFLFCYGVFHAARTLVMPVEYPEEHTLRIEGYGTLDLGRVPESLGLLALMREMESQALSPAMRMAIAIRVVHFGNILRAREKLSRWIEPTGNGGRLNISGSVIKACATARFVGRGKQMRFDLKDVARIAARHDEEAREREASHVFQQRTLPSLC